MRDGEPKLSKRLRCAAALVRPGVRAADVGCDHGKLAAWLVCTGRARSVVATDINPQPLEKARALFASLGITDRAQARLCPGLDGVRPDEADDIVIAGVGSEVTAGIIGGAPWLRDPDKRLILLPASHHERVRAFLYAAGFALVDEAAVLEGGHCYAAMLARYSGVCAEISAPFAALGLLRPGAGDADAYYERERRRALRVAEMTDDPGKAARARQILEYIERAYG